MSDSRRRPTPRWPPRSRFGAAPRRSAPTASARPCRAWSCRWPCAPGTRWPPAQPLVVIEAMKMQNPVRAPRAGRVGARARAPGALVAAGTVLVELTTGRATELRRCPRRIASRAVRVVARPGRPKAAARSWPGSLGWMLDSFDVMLYALVLAALMKDLGMSKFTAGLLGSVTLVASAVGGLVFGVVADRYGRTRALISSILIYSVFTAACGLAQTVAQLAVFRVFLGLGHGRRVGERRGAGLRDLVGRAPRQGARLHAERVGRRLRRSRRLSWRWSCPSGAGAPCSSSACCRRC